MILPFWQTIRGKCKKAKRWIYSWTLPENKKKLRSMSVMVIPIVVGVLCTVPKGWERRLEELEVRGKIKTIQITALLRLARILRRVLGTWGECFHFDFIKRPPADNVVKNLQIIIIIIILARRQDLVWIS